MTTPVVVVGAVDQNGAPASFSNFGDQQAVDAAAAVKRKPSQGETGTAPPPKNNPTKPAQHQKHRRKRR